MAWQSDGVLLLAAFVLFVVVVTLSWILIPM
jgi:hypothetical protein